MSVNSQLKKDIKSNFKIFILQNGAKGKGVDSKLLVNEWLKKPMPENWNQQFPASMQYSAKVAVLKGLMKEAKHELKAYGPACNFSSWSCSGGRKKRRRSRRKSRRGKKSRKSRRKRRKSRKKRKRRTRRRRRR